MHRKQETKVVNNGGIGFVGPVFRRRHDYRLCGYSVHIMTLRVTPEGYVFPDQAATIAALRAKVEVLTEAAEVEEHLRDKANESGDRLDAFTHHYAAMTIRTALATYTKAQEKDDE